VPASLERIIHEALQKSRGNRYQSARELLEDLKLLRQMLSPATAASYLDITPLGRQETWEDSPEGYPQTPPYQWWKWHDNYEVETAPSAKWLDMITGPEGAAARRRVEEAIGCGCS